MITSFDIIDSHCHYGSGDGFTGPWDTRADIRAYLIRARRAGITRIAFIPALANDYEKGNEEIAAIIKKYPRSFYAWIAINPAGDAGRVKTIIRRRLSSGRVAGIKIHFYNGRITREICQAAEYFSLPVLWDVGGNVAQAELVAGEYPKVAFIIPHLGSFADDWRAQKSCIDIMSRLPNVFTDSSGVRRFDLLREVIVRCGPDRVLFGSDGPWLHPAVELEKIRQLFLPLKQQHLVFRENFLRLIRADANIVRP